MFILVVLISVPVIVITIASFFLINRSDHINLNITCRILKLFNFSLSADKHNEKLHTTENHKKE